MSKDPKPLYPEIEVELIGQDSNALAIVGAVKTAMKRGDVPKTRIQDFQNEALSGDYDKVLQTAMKFVTVC